MSPHGEFNVESMVLLSKEEVKSERQQHENTCNYGIILICFRKTINFLVTKPTRNNPLKLLNHEKHFPQGFEIWEKTHDIYSFNEIFFACSQDESQIIGFPAGHLCILVCPSYHQAHNNTANITLLIERFTVVSQFMSFIYTYSMLNISLQKIRYTQLLLILSVE